MRLAMVSGVLALAVAAASANANVMVTVTDLGPVNGDNAALPHTVAPGTFEAFLVSVSASSGNLIGAVDAGDDANPGNSGFTGFMISAGTGGMLQLQALGSATPVEPYVTPFSNGTNDPYGLDSHFVYGTETKISVNPAEDFNSANLPNSPADTAGFYDFGSGTYLTGAVAFNAGTNVVDQPIAYIVLPTGASATYNIGIQEIDAVTKLNVGDVQARSGVIGVPEPASLGLLGLGSLLMLRRRRRA